MNNQSSINAVVIGGVVAALVIAAFVLGFSGAVESQGPAEQMGESIDKAAGEISEGIKGLKDDVEKAAGGSGS